MEGREDTCWGPPPVSIKYVTRKWRQTVSEGIRNWLGNEMWFQLWRLKQWVFTEHPLEPPHMVQGSWSNILLGLPMEMRSQKLQRGIFPPFLLRSWKVVIECLGFTLLWNTEWLGSRMNAENKTSSPAQIGGKKEGKQRCSAGATSLTSKHWKRRWHTHVWGHSDCSGRSTPVWPRQSLH